jgi:hypothetical protein
MTVTEIEALTAAYLAYARTRDDGLFDAWLDVTERISFRPPSETWPLVRELVRAAPDDLLDYIAAGPLEDFLKEHGRAWIEEVVRDVRKDERLRRALTGVWGLPPDVMEKLRFVVK